MRLAAGSIAGRTVTVRNLVAALRAGASIIAVPAALRDRAVERALAHMPALAAAVRWLEPGSRLPAGPPVPAASLVHTRILQSLIAGAATSDRVIMTTSPLDPAPVAILPRAIVGALWSRLASGSPVGPDLARLLKEWGAQPRASTDSFVAVRDAAARSRAEDALFDDLGIEADTGLDRCFHRRCSRWITRLLVNTPVTPSQVSIASLAVGSAAIWSFWRATPLSAVWGVILYAIGTEQLRGFAVTLVMGLVVNLFTAVFCARVVFDIAERQRWLKELKMLKLFGDTKIDFVAIMKPALMNTSPMMR